MSGGAPAERREAWLSGPVPGVPDPLQPVAHAWLQAVDEIWEAAGQLDVEAVNARPAGVASVAFHLRHIAGVVDRLLTYAAGEQLAPHQRAWLAEESSPTTAAGVELAAATIASLYESVNALKSFDPATLHEPREVGRARLPSTVLGLLFHAAEHTSRHVGQLIVTARVVAERAPR